MLSLLRKFNAPLLKELIIRDVGARYKGATIGMVWLALMPTLTLAIYVTIFKYIFKAKWVGIDADFYVILFAGMTFFGMLGDVINRAPAIIASNPNYIKKVIFPVEFLPVMVVGSALISFSATYVVLLIFTTISGSFSVGCIFALIVIPPFLILLLGVAMLVSALGVFYKDLQHFSVFITMLLMYSSPIFYPISAIPEEYRIIIYTNPVTLPVELFRNLYFHTEINWTDYLKLNVLAVAIFFIGGGVFHRVKGAFADEI